MQPATNKRKLKFFIRSHPFGFRYISRTLTLGAGLPANLAPPDPRLPDTAADHCALTQYLMKVSSGLQNLTLC